MRIKFHIKIINIMKQNRGQLMNKLPTKNSTVPRYSDKYKDILERAMKKDKEQEVSPAKQLFFYRVKSIGVGAFSFVYMVKQQNSGTTYAQKSIAKKSITGELFSEIKLHLYLNHPNIIRLYHVYDDKDFIYLIMEYAQDSLFSLRNNKKIPSKMQQSKIIQILRQILKAVCYLHSKGIIHGDLKLQNILITSDIIKICDLGLSTREGQNLSSQIKGTLQYLPPQYVKGVNSGYGRDIWAIGIIAYELITGKNPLEGLSENEKWAKMLTIEYIRIENTQVSEEMKKFITSTLCPAHQRKTSHGLLHLQLFQKPQTSQQTQLIDFSLE